MNQHLHNLPVQPTALEDRVDEIKQISRLLQDRNVSLVTLFGPSGVGKTRVALQVAAEVTHLFADGVFFIDLDTISQADLVLPKIAGTLGVQGAGGASYEDIVIDHLSERTVLLVFDNFEHVRSEAAKIRRLLSACQHVKALVTSRRVLVVPGEWTYEVIPLGLVHPGSTYTPASIMQSAAVRLFVQRARAVISDFRLTTKDAHAVAEICALLDGLPLAIELVVSRLRMFNPPLLLERLRGSGSRLALLETEAVGVEKRRQTMRDAIAWSYDLLDDDAKVLFPRISVFAGSFAWSAVESICDFDKRFAPALLEKTMNSLIINSLVRSEHSSGGPLRLRQLQTIREFGLERLRESGEYSQIHRTHALHFLQLVEHIEPRYSGANEQRYQEILRDEYDNLVAALHWARREKEFEIALRLAIVLSWHWERNSYLNIGRETLEALLAVAASDTSLPPQTLGKAYDKAGILARSQGQFDRAKELHDRSLSLYESAEDKLGLANAHLHLGNVARDIGNLPVATEQYTKSLHYWEALDISWGIAAVNNNLGAISLAQGKYEVAKSHFAESLRRMQQLKNRRGAAAAQFNLALATFSLSDLDEALQLVKQSLAWSKEADDRYSQANALDLLGEIARKREDYGVASRYYNEARGIREQLQEQRRLPFTMIHLGELASDTGDLTSAQEWYEKALALFRDGHVEQGIALTLLRLGELAEMRNSFAEAIDLASQSLKIFVQLRLTTHMESALNAISRIASKRQASEIAVKSAAAAFRMRNEMGIVLRDKALSQMEQHLKQLREDTGDQTFDELWREGQQESIDQLMTELLLESF